MLHILKFNNKNRKTKINRIDSRLANNPEFDDFEWKNVNLKMAWGQYKKMGTLHYKWKKAH